MRPPALGHLPDKDRQQPQPRLIDGVGAMDIGLVRVAMAFRVKYRTAQDKNKYRCLVWVCTSRSAEECTRRQRLFATWG